MSNKKGNRNQTAYSRDNHFELTEGIEKFLNFLSKTGHCTEHQARQILSNHEYDQITRAGMVTFNSCDTSKKRIKQLHQEGIISKEDRDRELKQGRASVEGLSLSRRGITYSKRHCAIYNFYSSPNAMFHNLKMAKTVLTLTDEERDSIKTEKEMATELKREIKRLQKEEPWKLDELKEKHEEKCPGFIEYLEEQKQYGSPCDFTYYSSQTQTWVCVEAISRNYTELEIQMKEFSAEVLGYEIQKVWV